MLAKRLHLAARLLLGTALFACGSEEEAVPEQSPNDVANVSIDGGENDAAVDVAEDLSVDFGYYPEPDAPSADVGDVADVRGDDASAPTPAKRTEVLLSVDCDAFLAGLDDYLIEAEACTASTDCVPFGGTSCGSRGLVGSFNHDYAEHFDAVYAREQACGQYYSAIMLEIHDAAPAPAAAYCSSVDNRCAGTSSTNDSCIDTDAGPDAGDGNMPDAG